MRGVLVIGGAKPPLTYAESIIRSADLVVAADSGFDYIWENSLPYDFVVGDMDSTRHAEVVRELPVEQVITASKEKDDTDTEMGLSVLRERGADHISLVGGGGGRLDHILGIVTLFDREIHPDEWYTEKERVVSIDTAMTFRGLRGREISFFPVGAGESRMKSSGLKWPLDQLKWKHGDAGISNLILEDSMTVEVIEGRLIGIYEF